MILFNIKKIKKFVGGCMLFLLILVLFVAFVIFLIKAGLSKNKGLRFISTFVFQLIGGIILAGVLFLICLLGVGFFKLILGLVNVSEVVIFLPTAIFIGVVGFYSVVFLKFIYLQIVFIISFGILSLLIQTPLLFFLGIYIAVGIIVLLIHGRGNIKEAFFERAWKRS